MQHKKIYQAISIIIGLVLLYSLGTTLYYTFKSSFFFNMGNFGRMLPAIIGLAGIIIFNSSNFKKSGMLRMFMCFQISSFPFTIWFYIKYFTGFSEFDIQKPEITLMLIAGIFFTLITVASCCVGLWLLSKQQQPKLVFIEYENERVGQFEPAGAGLRVTNRIVDAAIVLFFIFVYLIGGRLFFGHTRINSYLQFSILEIPLLIFYYLLMEGVFNTTAGKCVTNTVIVNESGGRPNFGQILGRTFCRLIPFDALSFLGNSTRGWHDSLSGTYVVVAAVPGEEDMYEITLDAELNDQKI